MVAYVTNAASINSENQEFYILIKLITWKLSYEALNEVFNLAYCILAVRNKFLQFAMFENAFFKIKQIKDVILTAEYSVLLKLFPIRLNTWAFNMIKSKIW